MTTFRYKYKPRFFHSTVLPVAGICLVATMLWQYIYWYKNTNPTFLSTIPFFLLTLLITFMIYRSIMIRISFHEIISNEGEFIIPTFTFRPKMETIYTQDIDSIRVSQLGLVIITKRNNRLFIKRSFLEKEDFNRLIINLRENTGRKI